MGASTDPTRAAAERSVNQPLYKLDAMCPRGRATSAQGGLPTRWRKLLAAHVRTNHVNVVVEAEVPPEKVMNDFKAYASRSLNRFDGGEPVGSGGHVTEAFDGCGRMRTFGTR